MEPKIRHSKDLKLFLIIGGIVSVIIILAVYFALMLSMPK